MNGDENKMEYRTAIVQGKKAYKSKVKQLNQVLGKKAGLPGKKIPVPEKFQNSLTQAKKGKTKVFKS